MALESVRDDLLVAGVAAVCAVTLTLSLELLVDVSVSVWLKSTPLAVYFAYLFSRKGGPYGPLDTAHNWAVLAVAVTVVAGAYALLV